MGWFASRSLQPVLYHDTPLFWRGGRRRASFPDDSLLALQPAATWIRLRNEIYEANLIRTNEQNLWSFRFPILAEALRTGWELEFDTLRTQVESMLGKIQ